MGGSIFAQRISLLIVVSFVMACIAGVISSMGGDSFLPVVIGGLICIAGLVVSAGLVCVRVVVWLEEAEELDRQQKLKRGN